MFYANIVKRMEKSGGGWALVFDDPDYYTVFIKDFETAVMLFLLPQYQMKKSKDKSRISVVGMTP